MTALQFPSNRSPYRGWWWNRGRWDRLWGLGAAQQTDTLLREWSAQHTRESSSWVGLAFNIPENIEVVSLGCWVDASFMSNPMTAVRIWQRTPSHTLLDEVLVPTGPAGFAYTELDTPIQLNTSSRYAVGAYGSSAGGNIAYQNEFWDNSDNNGCTLIDYNTFFQNLIRFWHGNSPNEGGGFTDRCWTVDLKYRVL